MWRRHNNHRRRNFSSRFGGGSSRTPLPYLADDGLGQSDDEGQGELVDKKSRIGGATRVSRKSSASRPRTRYKRMWSPLFLRQIFMPTPPRSPESSRSVFRINFLGVVHDRSVENMRAPTTGWRAR